MTSFLCKLSTKNNFQEVLPTFFRNTGLQHKLLVLIESPNIFHWKSGKKNKVSLVFGAKFGPNLVQCFEKTKDKLVFQWGFFYILYGVYIYNHEVVFIEIPE